MKNIPLSIILMVHNEEETIAQEVERYYSEIVRKLKGSELIIAEDGSTDKTRDILEKIKNKYSLILLTTPEKRGYYTSLRLSLEKAKGSLIFYADAGGKHDPEDFWKLYSKSKAFDIVSGYKKVRHDPWYRLVLAWGLNKLVSFYFGINCKDIDSGFKLLNRSALEKILNEKWLLRNNISLEIVLRAYYQGSTFTEVPIIHKARKFGQSRGLPPKKIISVVIKLLSEFPNLKRKMKELRVKKDEQQMITKYDEMFPEGNYRTVWEGKISVVYKLPKYLKIIKELLGKERQSVLEIGGGDGEIAECLLSDNNIQISSYTFTEYAQGGVKAAKDRLSKFKNLTVKQMDATKLDFKDKVFDTVFAIDVMHHVSDPYLMGQEMIRVSKNKVFLIESNALSIARRLAQMQTRYKLMGEKSYYPWQYKEFLSGDRVDKFNVRPFLFMVPKIPEKLIGLNTFVSEVMEKMPLIKWQCSGVIIEIKLSK